MALFAEQQRVHYSKAILEDRMAAKQAKPMSKTELLTSLSESTGLSKKDVSAVLDGLGEVIQKNLGKRGPGVFNLPGLLKIQVQRKPATKATTRENPFKRGEMMTVKAKPARNVVKVRPLKGLKDMV